LKDNTDISNEPLSQRWREVEDQFDDVVDCLRRESKFATGQLRLRLERVVELLDRNPTRDDVLANRDALATLHLLLDNQNGPVSVEFSVRKGVQRIAGNDVFRRNWLQLFWYPVLVVIAAFFVCVFLSFTVAPDFEKTLGGFANVSNNFQIETVQFHWVTRSALAIASFLRAMWIPIVVLSCAATGFIWWVNRTGRKTNSSGLGWWDERSISVRAALAIWSEHLASLLSIGVSQTDAFEIAKRDVPMASLRNFSTVLAERDRVIGQSEPMPYLPLRQYALLDHALKLNSLPAKVAALREVSIYYRDRDRYVSTWWMAWLSSAMLWMTGALVLGIFLAIFLPLHALIRDIAGLVAPLVGN